MEKAVRIVRRALNRAWFVILLIVGLWIIAGGLYSHLEGTSWFDGLWWASVTGTTTGYGDFYPVTPGGRILGVFYMSTMLVLTAFFVGHVVTAVIEDKHLFTNSEQERHEAALLLIGKALNVFHKDTNELPSLEELQRLGFNADPDDE